VRPLERVPSLEPAVWDRACSRLRWPMDPTDDDGIIDADAAAHALLRAELGVNDDCDDTEWADVQRGFTQHEGPYCVLSMLHDDCDQPLDAIRWGEARVAAFPASVDAHATLALLTLAPAMADDRSMAPNRRLHAEERRVFIDQALERFESARKAGFDANDYHVWCSLALDLRAETYEVGPPPWTEAQELDVIRARSDHYDAWAHIREVCDDRRLPGCPRDGPYSQDCCPPAPFPAKQRRADEKRRRVLERAVPPAE
jgi:hypothetical protein